MRVIRSDNKSPACSLRKPGSRLVCRSNIGAQGFVVLLVLDWSRQFDRERHRSLIPNQPQLGVLRLFLLHKFFAQLTNRADSLTIHAGDHIADLQAGFRSRGLWDNAANQDSLTLGGPKEVAEFSI